METTHHGCSGRRAPYGSSAEPRPERPSGVGTEAVSLPSLIAAARPSREPSYGDLLAGRHPRPVGGGGPGYVERAWGDGSHSPLYCPLPERADDALAAEVDARLASWARDRGFDDHELDALGKAAFGRLVTLAHPDTDDPDALLVAAQMNAGWWAADDYYADDTALGALPAMLPQRLTLVMSAMDPVPPAGEFTPPLSEALQGDVVLRMLGSAVDHLKRHASPVQVQRICYSTFAMFVSWTAYAAWREKGEHPPAWEYLAARQHDSFYTSMTLIDVLGGYEVPAQLYYDPRVRRAAFRAGTASVIVNDLHSVAKDAADENPVCNLVLLIAADEGCSVEEATETAVRLHNDLVRDFEAGHRELAGVPSPELQRFLRGLRAWMGGGFEWHATNPRYREGA
ncbi:family 2 encapsulin nanocompartment cargo protein terpene cyclase [Actinomadura citrea]|uniref:Terpene synthase n=1 Tax=Actinomadura citrea TaxID=46158 RepID=A0A7Y9G802_9ACTN|nr:family 2 encapsulin nanocompartment cargo protein terpene cyclase [Actinomadura citrea]NYE11594.1 2-methylisoborneol synthase [Actinomadura citrea]GGT87194.1 terpene synthase [Actinomadura citrea]